MTAPRTDLPVAVIGAGPVGLAAAAHLHERGLPFVVLEAGDRIGASVRQWGHVRLFSPWSYVVDDAARRLLEPGGWVAPCGDDYPTGAELVAAYLEPLASHPALAPHVQLGTRVLAVTRHGADKLSSAGREDLPFELVVATAAGTERLLAGAVIDAGGTWSTPNPLGSGGVPAPGEREAADRIDYRIPDVLGADLAAHAGRTTVVVGAGHSAFNAVLDLATLAERQPGTRVIWAVRRADLAGVFGGGENDALEQRGILGTKVRALVEQGRITVVTGFRTSEVRRDGERVVLVGSGPGGTTTLPPADRVIATTGFRPDLAMHTELRLELDAVVETTPKLAPLIDPNLHSCGTVRPHGATELAHPEQGFFIVGMKSYGRAPTFLLLTGYEQVRSVTAALAGDHAAATAVRLTLPETGVCSLDAVGDRRSPTPAAAACCA